MTGSGASDCRRPATARSLVTGVRAAHRALRRRTQLAFALPPVLAACGALRPEYRSSQQASRPSREAALADLARRRGVCSASFILLRGGEVGQPNFISGCDLAAPPQPVIYQAASLTKPVVDYLALQLVLAGRLDLDAPVAQYLFQGTLHFRHPLKRGDQDAKDVVPAALLKRIRVGSLLNHTSGLPNWSAGSLSLQFEPESRWNYSGEGYVLLQAVLEAVTAQPLGDLVRAQIFLPLGMQDSSLTRPRQADGRLAKGNTWFGLRHESSFAYPLAAASVYTTAPDYARFMSALLADDRVLALTLAQPVDVDAKRGLQWGQGWGIQGGDAGSKLWQWGNNGGFRAFAAVEVGSGSGFVILTNHDRGMPLAAALAGSVLPGEPRAFEFSMVR